MSIAKVLTVTTFAATVVVLINGCQPNQKYSGEFQWLNKANAKKDSQKAISQQQYKLIAIANRGQSLPGISEVQTPIAKHKCQFKFVKGLGDSRGKKGSEQRRQWQAAYDYAKVYNQELISYCI